MGFNSLVFSVSLCLLSPWLVILLYMHFWKKISSLEVDGMYDFPYRGAKGIVAGVIVGEDELTRRVFMILYRMEYLQIDILVPGLLIVSVQKIMQSFCRKRSCSTCLSC